MIIKKKKPNFLLTLLTFYIFSLCCWATSFSSHSNKKTSFWSSARAKPTIKPKNPVRLPNPRPGSSSWFGTLKQRLKIGAADTIANSFQEAVSPIVTTIFSEPFNRVNDWWTDAYGQTGFQDYVSARTAGLGALGLGAWGSYRWTRNYLKRREEERLARELLESVKDDPSVKGGL